MSVIVIEFITLDGVVSDPDGSGRTPAGGWAFRHGPETVAGDKFRLGSVLDNRVMLLGRTTWQLFSQLWPGRDDPFSARMNAVPKLVATRSSPTPRHGRTLESSTATSSAPSSASRAMPSSPAA